MTARAEQETTVTSGRDDSLVYIWSNNPVHVRRLRKDARVVQTEGDELSGQFTVMHIDHVQDRGCKSRACCRPSHLEPTTQAENNRRAAAHRRARLAADLAEMVAAA